MDEVPLRVSARSQVLAYLWENKTLSDKYVSLKKNLAIDAIDDLGNHYSEIPQFMLDYLSADLAALIEKHQPDLIEKLQAARAKAKSGKQAADIRSLFELKNGDAQAAVRIRQLLTEGAEVKELHFWLNELKRQNSREFEPLLRDVVVIAEGGPQISFETLIWLNPIYFHPDVSRPLQRSLAAMILTRTQPNNFIVTPAPQSAYELLSVALPYMQQLFPEFYEQARGQSLVLRAAINQTQLANEERSKRLKESQSPIETLVQEAESARTKGERNELLAEAAEVALQKKKFAQCLEIVAKLDLEVTTPGQIDFWRNWSSQFLKKLVRNAVTAKELEIAEKAALGMTASLSQVQSIAFIMHHWSDSGVKDNAHRLLVEAIKIAETISDEFEQAKAYLLLTIACDKSDESKKPQLLLSSVKSLNALNKPTTRRDQTPYQEYVRNLDNTGSQSLALARRSFNPERIPRRFTEMNLDFHCYCRVSSVSGDASVHPRRVVSTPSCCLWATENGLPSLCGTWIACWTSALPATFERN
jgi:hypothetical protein